MKLLVSFLGKQASGYQRVRYGYRGQVWPETAYFGLELARQLEVEELVLLGTAGSMWDVLLSDHFGSTELAAAHQVLLEAARAERVGEAQLQVLQPLIERAVGRAVRFHLIGKAAVRGEQQQLLSVLAGVAGAGDQVWLDVTHGYRHFPMLTLVAAAFLRSVRRVEIAGILYGAREMATADGVAPVVELDGLLAMLGWVEGLAAYDASGDLTRLAPVLDAAGLEARASADLRRAAFNERNQNTEAALAGLRHVRQQISDLESPALALLRPQLNQRLAWTAGATRWQREWQLAERHSERGDWLRACILWTEAAASQRLPANAGWNDREAAADELASEGGAYAELKRYRNALAHGNPAGGSATRARVAATLASPEKLPRELRRLADALLREMETASLPKRGAGA